MCGIIGYIGSKNAVDVLVDGLSHLAYRGYDSCGIAIFNEGKIETFKSEGKIDNLKPLVSTINANGIGIGHTRWATHGPATVLNAHPHGNEELTLVHNGIIENYDVLKQELIEMGYSFTSDTDTEVLVHLLSHYLETLPMMDAVQALHKRLDGAYAVGFMHKDRPDTLYAIRKGSPLIVGFDENEAYLASDISAIIDHTRDFFVMEDDELAILKRSRVSFYDLNTLRGIEKEMHTASWDIHSASKGNFDTFMLKEIYDQPAVLDATFSTPLSLDVSKLRNANAIHIVGCGTAMHAGLVAKDWIEKHAKKRVFVEVASEFRYRDPLLSPNDVVVIISQSGETADSLASLRLAKSRGVSTLAIVNVYGSSIQREADQYVLTHAGKEVAVASTKAYLAQLGILYQIAESITAHPLPSPLRLSKLVEEVLEQREVLTKTAHHFAGVENAFFIGRGLDAAIAVEGSLKLKEISYIHAESFPAGEMKHGTISLITPETLTVAIVTQPHIIDKTLSNIQEIRARGSQVLAVTPHGLEIPDGLVDAVIELPDCESDLMPFVAAIPLQIIAYAISTLRGCDVDQPRNLAKSVTVE